MSKLILLMGTTYVHIRNSNYTLLMITINDVLPRHIIQVRTVDYEVKDVP